MVEMIEDTSEFVKHLCCRHVCSWSTAYPKAAVFEGGETGSRCYGCFLRAGNMKVPQMKSLCCFCARDASRPTRDAGSSPG